MPLYLVGMSFLPQACLTSVYKISNVKHNLESCVCVCGVGGGGCPRAPEGSPAVALDLCLRCPRR